MALVTRFIDHMTDMGIVGSSHFGRVGTYEMYIWLFILLMVTASSVMCAGAAEGRTTVVSFYQFVAFIIIQLGKIYYAVEITGIFACLNLTNSF